MDRVNNELANASEPDEVSLFNDLEVSGHPAIGAKQPSSPTDVSFDREE